MFYMKNGFKSAYGKDRKLWRHTLVFCEFGNMNKIFGLVNMALSTVYYNS